MADVETTIKSSGGDYASLSLAEADDFGCTSGQSALCEYAEEMTDSTAVTINTSVPDSIEISVQSAYRHDGDVAEGAVLSPTASRGLNISVPVTLRHLRVDGTNLTSDNVYFNNINGSSSFNNIFIHDTQGSDIGLRVSNNVNNVVTGYRSVISSQITSGATYGAYVSVNATLNLYFCTVYQPNTAYIGVSNASTTNCYGCAVFTKYPFSGTIGGDYNADSTSNSSYQAPGSNSQNNLTATDELTSVSTDDFSVKSTSTGVKDNGYDYGTPYTDADIAGESISGTPDIGAFEYVAASTDWDNYIDGVQPAEVDGVAADSIEEIDGI